MPPAFALPGVAPPNADAAGSSRSRLTYRIRWRDDGVNLDAAELPVPEPVR